jgi:hypothetical protein
MANEQDFYRELADVPELPPDLFDDIRHRINRRALIKRSLFALAASLVLVIGSLQVVTMQPSRGTIVQPEVASELQTIHDYLNGSDLEGDLELYAVVEGY